MFPVKWRKDLPNALSNILYWHADLSFRNWPLTPPPPKCLLGAIDNVKIIDSVVFVRVVNGELIWFRLPGTRTARVVWSRPYREHVTSWYIAKIWIGISVLFSYRLSTEKKLDNQNLRDKETCLYSTDNFTDMITLTNARHLYTYIDGSTIWCA